MLNCSACGHDNFPFTNSQIHCWASGQSLQMVSKCHKCGARVAEECKVCRRLHPLNTTHCSIYGINIQDFLDLKTDIETRAEVFQNLPEAQEAMAQVARASYKFKRFFTAGAFFMLVGSISAFIFSSPLMGVLFIVGSVLGIGSAIWMFRIDSRMSKKMMVLWKEANPGVLEPSHINVYSKWISIGLGLNYQSYCPVTLEDRLLKQMLQQTQ